MILSLVVFASCAVALVVVTRRKRRRDPGTTVTGMFDRVLANRTARIAALLIWWWLGWHFLAGQTL